MDKFQGEIPGVTHVSWREFRYVSDNGYDHFFNNGLFIELTRKITPPLPKNGGAITENCKLWLPTGELFHALSYKGDIEGWRMQIEKGAIELGLLTGEIIEDRIVLSDGRCYDLSKCETQFY